MRHRRRVETGPRAYFGRPAATAADTRSIQTTADGERLGTGFAKHTVSAAEHARHGGKTGGRWLRVDGWLILCTAMQREPDLPDRLIEVPPHRFHLRLPRAQSAAERLLDELSAVFCACIVGGGCSIRTVESFGCTASELDCTLRIRRT